MGDRGTVQDKRIDAILRELESWRELIKQKLEPDAKRELERLIRQAEDQLRDIK